MDPDKVGEIKARGTLAGDLYIISHGEVRDQMRGRAEALLAAPPARQKIFCSSRRLTLKLSELAVALIVVSSAQPQRTKTGRSTAASPVPVPVLFDSHTYAC